MDKIVQNDEFVKVQNMDKITKPTSSLNKRL